MLRSLRHLLEVGMFAGLVGTTLWVFALVAAVVGGNYICDIAQSQCLTWLGVLVASCVGYLLAWRRELDRPRLSL